jgi:hypothetical protein
VTQSSVGQTICVSGWTTTVRPSSGYTTALKERQLATDYAYRGDTATGDYEEDHLLSGVATAPTPDLLGFLSPDVRLTTLSGTAASTNT